MNIAFLKLIQISKTSSWVQKLQRFGLLFLIFVIQVCLIPQNTEGARGYSGSRVRDNISKRPAGKVLILPLVRPFTPPGSANQYTNTPSALYDNAATAVSAAIRGLKMDTIVTSENFNHIDANLLRRISKEISTFGHLSSETLRRIASGVDATWVVIPTVSQRPKFMMPKTGSPLLLYGLKFFAFNFETASMIWEFAETDKKSFGLNQFGGLAERLLSRSNLMTK